ncbi:MAG TPA: hypothetical protein VL173_15295 [Vicinamibacterales bacterium]|nr:hypothetical protein [Vicinamibacterales bacterium]
MTAYRVVSGAEEDWFDEAAVADAAVAARLDIAPSDLASVRRRIALDPVVVRRNGSRWRSRQVWNFRTHGATVRVFEMLLIDEALYDH